MAPAEQAKHIGEAWERLPKKPNRQVCFHVVDPDGAVDDFTLGAHVPRLADADVDLIHTLWLDATKRGGVEDLHHKEIVTVALARLAEDLRGPGREKTIDGVAGAGWVSRPATTRRPACPDTDTSGRPRSFRDLLFGRPLATDEEGEQRVGCSPASRCSASTRSAPRPTGRRPR